MTTPLTKTQYQASVINSIADKYPKFRKASKTVTFALQYDGTWYTLMNNSGFSKEEAISIEEAYQDAYQVSIKWTADKVAQASHTGYVRLAYNARLQTPIISQTILGNNATPYDAEAEARSAGNALTQSYCYLNVDTLVKFMEKVWKSSFRHEILPIASIHDNNLFMIKDSYACVKFFNNNYIASLQDYSIPALEHPIVKLSGDVEIMHYDWSNPVKLKHDMTIQELLKLCSNL